MLMLMLMLMLTILQVYIVANTFETHCDWATWWSRWPTQKKTTWLGTVGPKDENTHWYKYEHRENTIEHTNMKVNTVREKTTLMATYWTAQASQLARHRCQFNNTLHNSAGAASQYTIYCVLCINAIHYKHNTQTTLHIAMYFTIQLLLLHRNETNHRPPLSDQGFTCKTSN